MTDYLIDLHDKKYVEPNKYADAVHYFKIKKLHASDHYMPGLTNREQKLVKDRRERQIKRYEERYPDFLEEWNKRNAQTKPIE